MGLFDRLRKVFGHKQDKENEETTSAASAVTPNESSANASQAASAVSVATPSATNTSSAPAIAAASAELPSESMVTAVTSAVNELTTSETTADIIQDEEQADQTAAEMEVQRHDEATAVIDDQQQFVADVTSANTDMVSEASSSSAPSATASQVDDEVSAASATPSAAIADEQTTTTAKYDKGLQKSRHTFSEKLNAFLANFRSVDEDFFDDLEEVMIEADVGFETTMKLTDALREEVKLKNAKKRKDVEEVIVEKLVDMYGEEGNDEDNTLHFATSDEPTVFLFVGVNGAGKTTTIGKLAHRYQQAGKKVLMVAGDTFRAGAIEQLQEWGRKVNVPVVAAAAGSDPAAVVFDAVKKAKAEHYDVLLVDTAGRLQNKVNLMKELEKIKRVITRELPDAPQETLLVLDATTGQNALLQAKQFKATTNVTGIVLTKLDGTAKGGIVLAIRNELHIPVKLVGLGEQMDDLQDFDPNRFIYGLFKELIVNDDHE